MAERKPKSKATTMKTVLGLLTGMAVTLLCGRAAAQLYWDGNGASPGAGGPTPSGTWDSDPFWSTSANGDVATGAWVDGSSAVFAAGGDATGSYTVTIGGAPWVTGLTFEEGDVTLSGGTLDFPGGGIIQVDATQATINSVISGGSGGLTQLGLGTLVLGGINTFTNTYSLVQGTLRMGASGDILGGAALSISSGATLDLNNNSVGIGSVGVATFSSGSSILLGSGTLTNLGIGPNTRYDGVISGSGNVVKTGSNTWTLGADNTYTGRTIVLGGVLSLAGNPPGDRLGTPPSVYVPDQLILDGGTLNFPSTSPTNIAATRGIYLGPAGGTITMASTKSPVIESPITGPGSLTKPSTGNLTLNAINTFAGDFIIRAGGVRFNSDAAAGTGTVLITPDANVFLRNLSPPGNVSTLTNPIVVNSGTGRVEFVVAQGDTFIVSGQISGDGPMGRGQTQTGNGGTLAFTGDNSGWSGGFWLLRGRVALGHRNALGTGTVVLQPAATGVNGVVLLAWTPLTGANAVNNPMIINVTNAATNALLNLGFGGTNALEWSGPIELSSTNSPLISPILNVTNTGGTILSGPINGGPGVGLTKAGSELLVLSGVSTYSGTTTVDDGTLLVNAPGSLAGPVVVNNGAALGGSGSISGSVTVNAGARISAGSSAGTLTLGNGLDLSAGGTNIWELAANSTANPGSDFDQIVLTGGNLVLGGSAALEIRFIGSATVPSGSDPFWQQNHSWKIIALNGGSNPGNTLFSTITGTNGLTAGTFSLSADASGVYLNYTTAAPPPPLLRPTITAITGAGSGTVTVHYTNTIPGTAYVLQYSTNLATTDWYDTATNTASGTSDSQTDNPLPGTSRRFYRVYYVAP